MRSEVGRLHPNPTDCLTLTQGCARWRPDPHPPPRPPHSGKRASGDGCGKGGSSVSRHETKEELYERAKATGKEVRMCSHCAKLGIEKAQHWMPKEVWLAAGFDTRKLCGRYTRLPE